MPWTALQLSNCTLLNNSDLSMGGIVSEDSIITVTNSILWGNLPQEIYVVSGEDPNITSSCIENGYPGDDNLDSDPMFLTWPEDGCLFDDYHLDVNSPCIDLGDPCNVVGLFDVDLDQRITGKGVDIGADEVQPEAEGPPEPNYTGAFDLLIYDYSDGQVKRWDPKTGLYEGAQVPRHAGYLMNVTGWTPVGDLCVVVGNYDRIYSWNRASLDLIIQDGTLGGPGDAVFQSTAQGTYMYVNDVELNKYTYTSHSDRSPDTSRGEVEKSVCD